jgi:hypothetical protein
MGRIGRGEPLRGLNGQPTSSLQHQLDLPVAHHVDPSGAFLPQLAIDEDHQSPKVAQIVRSRHALDRRLEARGDRPIALSEVSVLLERIYPREPTGERGEDDGRDDEVLRCLASPRCAAWASAAKPADRRPGRSGTACGEPQDRSRTNLSASAVILELLNERAARGRASRPDPRPRRRFAWAGVSVFLY